MKHPEVVFFDLDHTLIDTDCEQAWVNMLVDMGLAPEENRARQDEYMELHAQGKTPIDEYIEFMAGAFGGKQKSRMAELAMRNFELNILDKIFPQARVELDDIRRDGGRTVLLSGSVRPIVVPFAENMGFAPQDILCTELEEDGDSYTGRIIGELCIRQGKLDSAKNFCEQNAVKVMNAGFYGDSLSDVPMFEWIGHANVVNPRPELADMANANGWRVVDWSC